MRMSLLTNEQLVKEGFANLQRGWETVGGRLYLTNQRLIFESHPFNVQRGTTIVPLPNIAVVQETWTKFLNQIPIANNSIAVTTNEEREYRIVVWGRRDWIEAIMRQQHVTSS
jgi:hypothetical protein